MAKQNAILAGVVSAMTAHITERLVTGVPRVSVARLKLVACRRISQNRPFSNVAMGRVQLAVGTGCVVDMDTA